MWLIIWFSNFRLERVCFKGQLVKILQYGNIEVHRHYTMLLLYCVDVLLLFYVCKLWKRLNSTAKYLHGYAKTTRLLNKQYYNIRHSCKHSVYTTASTSSIKKAFGVISGPANGSICYMCCCLCLCLMYTLFLHQSPVLDQF